MGVVEGSDALTCAVREGVPEGAGLVLVAVSGGIDSTVLLDLLVSIGNATGLRLQVAHLDHQLRRESSADADFVEQLAGTYGLHCHRRRVDVSALAKNRKISLEMAGREARRDFLEEVAIDQGADLIALAHHQDDQAETLLLRLVRGSWNSGLGCMKSLHGRWWRPLLGVSRQQIEQYARQRDLRWVEDSSNQDIVFARNLIRGHVMPLLRKINPQTSARLARSAEAFRLEEEFWQDLTEAKLTVLTLAADDGLKLARSPLIDFHKALRLRIYREALRRIRTDVAGIESVHLESIDNLMLGDRSQAQIDLPDAWIARRYDTLWLRQSPPGRPQIFDVPLPVPGKINVPGGRRIEASVLDVSRGESDTAVEFSLAGLDGPFRVRHWRAGDRFVPSGMIGHKKLKSFFSDNRVDREVRDNALILTSAETILWVIGMRRSACAPVACDGSKILRLELV